MKHDSPAFPMAQAPLAGAMACFLAGLAWAVPPARAETPLVLAQDGTSHYAIVQAKAPTEARRGTRNTGSSDMP